MKLNVYYFLFLMIATFTLAQQRNTSLTARQQKLLMIQQGTCLTAFEAERLLKQEEDGWRLCKTGAVTAIATAAFWATLEYQGSSTPSQAEVLKCCCNSCGLLTYALCSLGCCGICDCC